MVCNQGYSDPKGILVKRRQYNVKVVSGKSSFDGSRGTIDMCVYCPNFHTV